MSAGTAQKSPQTQRIAAPICWSANGGRVTPGTCAYTLYQLSAVKIESDMARTNITMLVETMAPACQSGEALMRNGWEGMIWSQNSTPVTKKLACMSQMWTSWLFSARSKSPGTCQNT